MKRFYPLGFVLVLVLTLLGGNFVNAEMDSKDAEQEKVELTEAQKQELDALYKDLLETKKTILNKYVEYGVITKEKADKKLAWMDEHYNKVKEHGYLPMHGHHKWDKNKGND